MENNEKSNKGLVILIVIFSLMVLGLGGWMVYDKVINKDEPKPVEGGSTKDNTCHEKNNVDDGGLTLVEGYYGMRELNPYVEDQYQNINVCDKQIIKTIKCNIKCIDNNGQYYLYEDNNSLKIFDNENDKYYLTELEYKNENYYYLSTYNDKLMGIMIESDTNYDELYYSLINGEILKTNNKYTNMELLNDKYLSGVRSNEKYQYVEIISIYDGEVLLSEKKEIDDEHEFRLEFLDDNHNYFAFFGACDASCSEHYSKIYTNDLKLISGEFNDISLDENGNLIILENNVLYTYDKKGNKIKEISSYSDILAINGEYVLNQNDNKVVLYYKGNILKDIAILDVNEKDIDSFFERDEAIVYVKSSKVTLDDIWNDYKKFNSYTQYPFEAESKSDLKKWLKENECDNGYKYSYNIKTKQLTKFAVAHCGEW